MDTTYLRLHASSSEALNVESGKPVGGSEQQKCKRGSVCRKIIISCTTLTIVLVILYAAAARAGVVRSGCFSSSHAIDGPTEVPLPATMYDGVISLVNNNDVSAREGCKHFFDGCNDCTRQGPSDEFACTEKACVRSLPSRCVESFAKPRAVIHDAQPDDPGCKSYFDGCNRCRRGSPGGPLACTMMLCTPEQKKNARCTERFEDENAGVTKTTTKPMVAEDAAPQPESLDAPDNCQLWDSGCNKCRRGSPGAALACTRMMCHGARRTPRCLRFFDTDAEQDEAQATEQGIRVAPAPVSDDCKQFFDGCNMCRRGARGDQLACTRMACAHYQEAECVEKFE